ncbi:MAG TPA: DUF3147 family protein [Burkholderiales bacterium]|nr:DUF3147 family protein [Burkholderiales bacterium]
MLYYTVKALVSALIIVLITEVAKRSTWLGALVAALPLTSLMAFVWLYWETGDAPRIASLSLNIFWLVIPSLALFLALPLFVRLGWGFWISLLLAIALTAACYGLLFWVLRRIGLQP